jgi:hypothetical protein
MCFKNVLLGAAVVVALVGHAAKAGASARAPLYFDAGSAAVRDDMREATLARLDGLGVRALRVSLVWAAVAPEPNATARPAFDAADPNAYDWGGYGRLIDAARARGWRVLVTFTAPVPRWATAARSDQVTRPSDSEFRAFATAAGRRFGDAVSAWGLWNEPNHPRFLKPQYVKGKPASPALYRALHLAGVRGLEAAGQSGDTFLGGETAPGGDRRTSVPPLQFLRGVFCKGCAKLRIDGWAHHPYANRRGPYYVPPDRDNVTIGVLPRLERALDAVGRKATPVWITEFGVQSSPDTTRSRSTCCSTTSRCRGSSPDCSPAPDAPSRRSTSSACRSPRDGPARPCCCGAWSGRRPARRAWRCSSGTGRRRARRSRRPVRRTPPARGRRASDTERDARSACDGQLRTGRPTWVHPSGCTDSPKAGHGPAPPKHHPECGWMNVTRREHIRSSGTTPTAADAHRTPDHVRLRSPPAPLAPR